MAGFSAQLWNTIWGFFSEKDFHVELSEKRRWSPIDSEAWEKRKCENETIPTSFRALFVF